jgi:hypothetical protein
MPPQQVRDLSFDGTCENSLSRQAFYSSSDFGNRVDLSRGKQIHEVITAN